MIGPRPAPKSVRLSDDTVKRLAAYAKRNKMTEHAAMAGFINDGLARDQQKRTQPRSES